MSKPKGNRPLESAIYGTPMLLFSDTHDGRIVTMQHRQMLQNEEFSKQTKALQEATFQEVARIREENLSRGQGELNTEQIVGVLGNLLDETKRLSLMQGMEAMRTDETGKAVKEAAQSIKGPEKSDEPLRASLEGGEDLAATLELLGCGALNDKGSGELFHILDEPLREDSQKAVKEIDAIKEQMREIGAGQNELSALDDAYNSISSIHGVLNNPQKAMDSLKILKGYTLGESNSGIKALVRKMSVILRQFMGRRGKPASPDLLVKLTNSGYLTDPAANAVMEKYPEARKRASMTSMNYSLMDIERETRTNTQHLAGIRRAEESALGQRDTMIGQGVAGIEQREVIINQGVTGIEQREVIINQGVTGIEQRDAIISQGNTRIAQGNSMIGQGRAMIGILDDLRSLASTGAEWQAIIAGNSERISQLQEDQIEIAENMESYLESINSGQDEQTEVLQNLYEEASTANDYLAGLNEQTELVRYKLEQLIDTLSENHEDLVDSIENVGSVMGSLMEELVEQGNYHGELLFQLSNEIILTRVEISSRLKKVGKNLRKEVARQGASIRSGIEVGVQTITTEITRGNELLEQLLSLNINSLTNEAAQRFSAGRIVLATARGEMDFKDAYKSFLAGIKANRSFAENYFGAGIVAEQLGMREKAINHFDRAGRRGSIGQESMASKAFEGEARLLYVSGEIDRALDAAGLAIGKDPGNLTARFMQIKFSLEAEKTDGVPEMVVAWAKYDENQLLHLFVEPAYVNAPAETKSMIMEALWKANIPRNSYVTVSLLEAAMEINSPLCKDIFYRTLLIAPGLLLEKKIWRHPAFEGIKRTLFDGVMRLSSKDLDMVIAQDCAHLAVLYAKCDFPRNYLRKVIERLKNMKAKDDDEFWNRLIGLAGDDPAAQEKLRAVIN